MASGVVVLNEEHLSQLASIIHNNEKQVISNIQFKSEQERSQNILDSQDIKTKIESLLNLVVDAKKEFMGDQVKEPVAIDIYHYSVSSINFALQMIKNYTVRKPFVEMIKSHCEELLAALKTLGQQEEDKARMLAETAAFFRETTARLFEKSQFSYSSRSFSKLVKKRGIKFQDLIMEHQIKLGFGGMFKILTNAQKLQVYEKIIEASGRGNLALEVIRTVLAANGMSLLVFMAGTIVWDIFAAERPLKNLIAGHGGAADIWSIVKETILNSEDEVEKDAAFVACAGFLTGVAGAFMIAENACVVIDGIFSTGGETPPPEYMDGRICYVSPLPDGAALALLLLYDGIEN